MVAGVELAVKSETRTTTMYSLKLMKNGLDRRHKGELSGASMRKLPSIVVRGVSAKKRSERVISKSSKTESSDISLCS